MLPAPLLSAPNAVPLNTRDVYAHHEYLKKTSKCMTRTTITLPHLRHDIEVGPHLQRISKDETLSLEKEAFYREHLLSKEAKTQTLALIIPYEELDKLYQRFPNIKVRYFESSCDFYFPAAATWSHHESRNLHDLVIDTCNDAELWDTATTAIFEEQFIVDVIIHQQYFSHISYDLMEQLAARRWTHNPECQWLFGFKISDKSTSMFRRREDAPVDSPNFILSPMHDAVTHRLPLEGGGKDAAILEEIAKEAQEVINRLQSVANGCGWFIGTPTVTILNFHTDVIKSNILCEPGTEYLYALPVSSDQVIDWILYGKVRSGKVLLVKCRFDLDRRLNADIDNNHRVGNDEANEAIYATGATHVVFYCNNASTNSPRDVVAYHKWLRTTHSESKQCCLLLENGVNGMFRTMHSDGYSVEERLKVFARI